MLISGLVFFPFCLVKISADPSKLVDYSLQVAYYALICNKVYQAYSASAIEKNSWMAVRLLLWVYKANLPEFILQAALQFILHKLGVGLDFIT